MDNQGCCSDREKRESGCSACDGGAPRMYWCETCQRLVAEKRCPGCGLKTVKARSRTKS